MIVVERPGPAEALIVKQRPLPAPSANEVVIAQTAIGVNFHDCYVRSGAYRTMAYPGTPGIEGAGVVEQVGRSVVGVRIGDRVAYVSGSYGGYATRRAIAADSLVPVPDDVALDVAAAALLKGLTADMLLGRVGAVSAGTVILIHGAAGGVGQILIQMAAARGARVIGVVGDARKSELAASLGCEQVLVRGRDDIVSAVREFSSGRGADLVLDGIGLATFETSLESLAAFGHLSVFGQASGPVPPVPLSRLAKRSLTISRPIVFHHIEDQRRYRLSAAALFDALRARGVAVAPPTRFSLSRASDAHRLLESGGSTGSVILEP